MHAEFYIFKGEAGQGVQFKMQCGLESTGKHPWVWSLRRKGNPLGFLLPVGSKVFVCFLNIYETNLHFGFLRTRSSASVSILRGVPTKANVPPRKIPTALSLELCLPDFSLPLLLILAAFVWKVLPISCLILLSEELEGRTTLLPKSALSLEESKCYPNAAT